MGRFSLSRFEKEYKEWWHEYHYHLYSVCIPLQNITKSAKKFLIIDRIEVYNSNILNIASVFFQNLSCLSIEPLVVVMDLGSNLLSSPMKNLKTYISDEKACRYWQAFWNPLIKNLYGHLKCATIIYHAKSCSEGCILWVVLQKSSRKSW